MCPWTVTRLLWQPLLPPVQAARLERSPISPQTAATLGRGLIPIPAPVFFNLNRDMLDIESLRHADFYGRHDSARSLPLSRNDLHSKQMLFRGDGSYMAEMCVAALGHVLLQIGFDIGNAATRRSAPDNNMSR